MNRPLTSIVSLIFLLIYSTCLFSHDAPKIARSVIQLLEERNWESDSGFKTTATYAGFDPTKNAVMLNIKGKIRKVEFKKLSEKDQRFLSAFLEKSHGAIQVLRTAFEETKGNLTAKLKDLEAEVTQKQTQINILAQEVKRLEKFEPEKLQRTESE